MTTTEYAEFDGLGLAKLIASGEVSAAEVMEAARLAIEAVNPRINAVVESWTDETPECTDAPFFGVPFLVKDLAIDMAGRKSELGSRLAIGLTSEADSNLMRRFRRAGLVTVGRTTTPEMAISTTTESLLNGPTRNPWNLERSAGGSSGGSGAAVAAGVVPIAHATDGGGSIRVPAASNGIFGLKPTRGRISNGPAIDEVWSGFAVHFAMSRSVRDSAALLDCAQGGDIGEPYYIPAPERPYLSEMMRSPGRLRIALMVDPLNGKQTLTSIAEATRQVALHLEALGHEITEVKLDPGVSWESFVNSNVQVWTSNTAAWLDHIASMTGRDIGDSTIEPATLAVYRYGKQVSAIDLLSALNVRNTVTRHLGRFFQSYDVLLTPTLPDLPPLIGSYNAGQETVSGEQWVARVFEHSPFTALFNTAGSPAMSVPLSVDAMTGLPIGAQFAADFGREDLLLRLASQLEETLPWKGRKPQVWVGDQ